MKTVRSISEMAAVGGSDLALVPTMGAFHDGHLSLMRAARQGHARVIVSLFVNPLQFGRNEDLSRYPRDEARDFALAESVGVDIVFAPDHRAMYPRGTATIRIPEIADLWEGAFRPGHFTGVATVVAKLLNIIHPHTAYFGWKDLQQCLVIRRLVEDLNFSTKLSFHETVREPDGLALSSRNAYLNPEQRQQAPELYRAICRVADAVREVGPDPEAIDQTVEFEWRALSEMGFDVDYLELVSLTHLKPLRQAGGAAVIVAARLGDTRLIDNVRLIVS